MPPLLCVVCRAPIAAGALKCPECGADRPYRSRPTRSAALAKRRRVVLLGSLAAGLAVVLFFVLSAGGSRSQACRDYDSARSRYDRALSGGADPTEPAQTTLQAEVERLQAACANG